MTERAEYDRQSVLSTTLSTIASSPSSSVDALLKPARRATRRVSEGWGFPEFFVISQTVFPALLYLPGTQPLRMPIRVSAFAISLAALLVWLAKGRSGKRAHPSAAWLIMTLAWLGLMVFHPTTNTMIAGAAQVALYLAVMAPVFWAPDMVDTPQRLRRLLAILLVCNGVNAAVGMLQVYDPDRWLPREYSTIVEPQGGPLTFTGADGREIVRPPGLSDSPGAVCGPAAAAGLLGLVFCAMPGLPSWRRIASLAFAFIGIATLYLTHVRSSMIVLVASLVAYIGLLYLQRRMQQAAALLILGSALLFGGLTFAVSFGGEAVVARFAALFEEDPGTTYYNSRGNQLEHALREHLMDYPFGAGLARWGMMRHYFGDETNRNSPSIWAEIQIPSWILDGGLILILLYGAALGAAMLYELRLARRDDSELSLLAALVFAVNLGTLALVFSYTPFVSAIGVQYWFLAGALRGVAGRTPVEAFASTTQRTL